jgi:hypothetical protein
MFLTPSWRSGASKAQRTATYDTYNNLYLSLPVSGRNSTGQVDQYNFA